MSVPQQISRRRFMVGCSAAIAALAGSRLGRMAFTSPGAAGSADTLVVVFLRGGWDAMNVVPIIDGPDRAFYEAARPTLRIGTRGQSAALRLDERFGLHPAMAPLYSLYQDKKLAVVHAVGLDYNTRSHFDAMEFIELGTPGNKTTPDGWITRHLQSTPNLPAGVLMPAVTTGDAPTALLASRNAVLMGAQANFGLLGNEAYLADQRVALRQLYTGDTWLHHSGQRTLEAVDVMERAAVGEYAPANGAAYPDNDFGGNLKTIAQMIKLDVGLRVGALDLGGWDTHEYEGDAGGGYMAGLLNTLAQGLAALYTDLSGSGGQDYASRMTLVVISEFGRRLTQNASAGTDHGHGSAMLVLGGHVNGGKVHGAWPGLRNEQLFEREDLAVTTDYRQVLGEVLLSRLGNPHLEVVFPGYRDYKPLGIVQPNTP